MDSRSVYCGVLPKINKIKEEVKGSTERVMPLTCESIRPVVVKYFGEYTNQALFVSEKESGCQNIRSYKQNSDGTYDYCPFQINNEPSTLKSLDKCVSRAWDKFSPYKHWSQWYAVCNPERTAKYSEIKCK